MGDARRHERIACQLPVEVCSATETAPQQFRTSNVGLGGLFAVGYSPPAGDAPVRVGIGPSGMDRLRFNSRVAHVSRGGSGLAFVDNSPSELELLRAMLEPVWDGTPLLEGVIRLAPWHDHESLASWMRLTSLVAEWQNLKHY